MKTYLSIMLIYWLIADGDITFMNFHRTTAFLHRTTTFRTTRRAIDYYMCDWEVWENPFARPCFLVILPF